MPVRGRLLFIAALTVLCAWLGAMLYDELGAPQAAVIVPAPQADAKPKLRAAALTQQAFNLPSMTELAEMVERPLFFEGRKLPAEAATPAAPTVPGKPPGKVILTGIVISPDERTALVKEVGAKEVISVTVGQKINSWKLEEIHPDRILIRWGDRVEEVKIEDNKAPRSARRSTRKLTGAGQTQGVTPQQRRRDRIRDRAKRTPGRTTR